MIAIVLSLFAAIAPKLVFNLSPVELVSPTEESLHLSYIWWQTGPNNNCIAFFSGIIFGYLLDSNVQISYLKSVMFWIYTITVCPLIFVLYNSLWSPDLSAPIMHIYLWYTLGKLLFCTGWGWVYFACCTGKGGMSSTLEPFGVEDQRHH